MTQYKGQRELTSLPLHNSTGDLMNYSKSFILYRALLKLL